MMKFQINKTELQRITKDLGIRVTALPTLKSKESALRYEIKKIRANYKILEEQYALLKEEFADLYPLYSDFNYKLEIDEIHTSSKKIAGVAIATLEDISFKHPPLILFTYPSWFLDAIKKLEEATQKRVALLVEQEKIAILEHARKKTTQKVNLYEKVQIPAFKNAIITIKRFIEDEENLNRASQKIIKKRVATL